MQNELRFRRLYKSKVVGYGLYCTLKHAKEIELNIHWDARPEVKDKNNLILFWKNNENVWWGCPPMTAVKADSFELCSPFKDKNDVQLFEGDIVQVEWTSEKYENGEPTGEKEQGTNKGVIVFVRGRFGVEKVDADEMDKEIGDDEIPMDLFLSRGQEKSEELEKIGDIHKIIF